MSRRRRKADLAAVMRPHDWAEVLADYDEAHASNESAEFRWFTQQPSLVSAVTVAAQAKDALGKRCDHQRRIKRSAIKAACAKLLANKTALANSRSFHDLWQAVELLLLPVSGIGELYCYDTALRIGAFLHLEPDRVYLHAGTRKGARALNLPHRQRWLWPSDMPELLSQRHSREIENILCIYANDFAGLRRRKPRHQCR